MAVTITDEELDLFNKNGFTDDDVRATVENYRSQGLDDNDIRAKVQSKIDSWNAHQNVKQPINNAQGEVEEVSTQPDLRLTGEVKKYNESANPVRNAIRQFSRNTARFILPKKVENWFLGPKEDEEFLKKYNDDNVMSYEDAATLYKQGLISKDEFMKNTGLRLRLDSLKADAEYRDVRNTNIGKGVVDIGTAAIPFGGAGKVSTTVAGKLTPYLNRKIATEATKGAVIGGKAGLVHGVGYGLVDEDINPLTQGLVEGGIGIVGGGLLGAGAGKLERMRRAKDIAKRRATPLADRMTEEQLERFTRPETKPSQYGVADIDTNTNKAIAQQIENNIRAEEEILRLYKQERADIIKKYGSAEELKAQAYNDLADERDYGIVSDALKDYRFLQSMEVDLQGAKYISTNIKPITTREGVIVENVSKPTKQQPTSKVKPQVNQEVIEQPIQQVDEVVESVPQQLDDVIPEQVVETTQTGKMKQSKLAQKANKSDEVAQSIQENPPLYEAINNAETIAQAQSEISQNASKVHTDTIRKLIDENAEVTALDVEKARQIFNELQKQGRFDEATDLLELTSRQGSKLGQAVQAFSLWSKTTPDGAMLYAQKLLDKYNKGVRKNLQKRLSEKELRDIGETFQKLNESGLTGRELEVETAKAMKKVFKVVPKTFAQKLDGYRYINMLLSPQSRIKDFILTAKNAADTAIDESIAGGLDYLRTLGGKDKTRYISANPFAGTKAWLQGAKKGFKESLEDIRYGINTSRSGEVGRYGLPNTPTFKEANFEGGLLDRLKTLKSNPLGSAEKLLRYTLQVPDRMFFEARYASSLANQMEARGVTEPTQDMINRAVEEAKRAVFQEDRLVTKRLSGAAQLADIPIEALENVIGLPQGTLPSASKGLAPFVKTPTNVIAQGAEGLHGLGSGGLQLSKAGDNPELIREAELLMGRGIRGLGELGLGYAVGKGLWDKIKTNIGEEDYYKNEITGLQPSSLVIGNKAISLQNMQNNLPFFTGAGLGQRGLGKAFTNTTDIIAEMPALKALGDLYNVNKEANYIAKSEDPDKELLKKGSRAARSLGANYLTTLIPVGGWLGELRTDIDPFARELYAPDRYDEGILQGLSSDAEYLKNRVQNRIPGLSMLLPNRYNSLGQPIMSNNIDNDFLRGLSQAVNFGVRNYNEPPAEMEEMQRIQDYAMENNIEGKTTLKFAKPKRYIGRGKDKINLTNEQYSELTRLYNGKVYDELQFLMNTPEYQSADEETQIKWVREVMKEKKQEAEQEISDIIK